MVTATTYRDFLDDAETLIREMLGNSTRFVVERDEQSHPRGLDGELTRDTITVRLCEGSVDEPDLLLVYKSGWSAIIRFENPITDLFCESEICFSFCNGNNPLTSIEGHLEELLELEF